MDEAGGLHERAPGLRRSVDAGATRSFAAGAFALLALLVLAAMPGGADPLNRAMGTGEAREPTPFTLADRYLDAVRRGDRADVERALELGVDVGSRDDLGRSALLLAARDAGDLSLVRFLHERGAALDEPDLGGRTALSFAAARGHVDIVLYLLDGGAGLDRADGRGRTPFFHAVLANQKEIAALLLDRGARVDVRDRFRDTPLMLACAKGFDDLAALLLARGADPSLTDQEGRTAADRAAPGATSCRGASPT
jgi:ankyrin repeat protein